MAVFLRCQGVRVIGSLSISRGKGLRLHQVFWIFAQPVYFSLARTPLMVAAVHFSLPVTVKM